MKNNTCPYLDSQNRCTHKIREKTKKSPHCQYNNQNKCRYYNEWADKLKSLRIAKNEDEATIRTWVEEMKRRWIK